MRRFTAGNNFQLWFGGLWLFVGAPFLIIGLYIGAQNLLTTKRLETEGRTVEAVVLTKSIKSSSSRRHRNSSPSYHTTFRFVTPTGIHTGSAEVSSEAWEKLIERGPIQVTYLPNSPESYRVEGQSGGWILPIIFSALGSVFSSIGGFLLVRGLSQVRSRERLQREGVPVQGTVIDVGPSRLWLNGVQQWALQYEYQDDRGRRYQGKIGSMPPEEAETWKAGDQGTVRYDRRQPKRSTWIGKH
jgi:hypothetical protein